MKVVSVIERELELDTDMDIEIEEYFSYLLQQYEKLVYSICYQTCKNPFDAQDLTQDTFLSVYKHLGTFDRQYERAWICRIASNKAIDYMKSKKRTEECKEDEFFVQVEDSSNGPEEAYIQKETKALILSVCNQLKSPYREVAYEHFYLEKTMAEIAKEQDTNVKTVQTRVYRARAQIRKLLKGGEGL
ncbi:MAG: sigma-70 family RNA polymerase sigma factor [Lachnospiraceae bacterium]|nr:sigma-70 family RNA polymerase sigma factor [Lachnospiraceae bacterium]